VEDTPYMEQYEDPKLGWSPRIAAPIAVVDATGGHSSLLQEPHVRVVAQALRSGIAQATRGAPIEEAA
jgi:thioesterase domain-containing protein